jgi:hypothetical protein
MALLTIALTGGPRTASAQAPEPDDGRLPATQVVAAAPPLAVAAPPAAESRAALLQQQREIKASGLERYEPTGLERMMTVAETRALPLIERDGLYAKFGSITTGSGFAYGIGVRDRSLRRGRGLIDLWGAGSFKGYWAVNARVRHPVTNAGRVFVEAYARRYAYPREEFTGIGPESLRANRVAYTLRGTLAGAALSVEPAPHLSIGGGTEWQAPEVGAGESPAWPTIGTFFDGSTAPGLDGASRYIRPHVFAAYDYREPRNPRQGGLYRVDLSHVSDRSGGPYSFTRLDLDLRQYIGLLDGRRVFALRALASTTREDEGAEVPFYLLPSLGGNDTLRGFRALRFRGPHRLLLQGEYRWDVWSGLEAALFFDAGKVAMKRSHLGLRDLEKNWGFGFRFNTDNGIIMRVDTALGSQDGPHLHIVFGGVF